MKRKYQKLIQRPNLKQKKVLVENFGAVKEAYLEIIDENKDLVKQLECKISTMDNNIVKLQEKVSSFRCKVKKLEKENCMLMEKLSKTEKQRVKKQHA